VSSSTFIHVVFFWLKEGASPDDADKIAAGCRSYLSGIPGVLRLAVGKPAGTPRDVVDSSYGLSLLVEFADSAAHDIYQDHPDHLQFIAECGPFWSGVQVYDSLT
jgi:hypothetical protein